LTFLCFRSSNNIYGRLPSGITPDEENLINPSDESDTFSPIDSISNITHNNLNKQGNTIQLIICITFCNIFFTLKLTFNIFNKNVIDNLVLFPNIKMKLWSFYFYFIYDMT